jgi:hypothetical protein
MKTYKGQITKLEDNQIFCFGANPEGRHGKGAALWAKQNAGAIYGVGYGRQGKSYAIATKDLRKKVHPSISKESIIEQISKLYEYARSNEELEFLVAYSGTGTNLNGYTNHEMADMFLSAGHIPDNMVFEETFYLLMQENTCM